MVKKVLFILFTFGLISEHLWAAPVTAEQAAQKAKRFMITKMGGVELAPALAHGAAMARDYTDTAAPLLYVFNVGNDEGFIIISGEDSTPEILAYTEKGSYDYDQLPDNARWWIDNYAKQIEALRQSGVQAVSETVEVHDAIEPLLTCQWDQDEPYNNSCPAFSFWDQTVTGCVATAMAQVLYHHRAKSVPALQATIPAYLCYHNWIVDSDTSVDLDTIKVSVDSFTAGSIIDWNNMLDTYNRSATSAQKKAVADLMAYCGASVEMDYAPSWAGGSGASDVSIPEAFKKYFGYSETATVKYRDHFTTDNWDRLVYRELMNGRPVIVSGQDENGGGGHAFVCDGYGEDGKYHFNWGWGGMADGYYVITNLQPTSQGIGGNGGYAFNDKVSAVIGMEPGDGTPYEEKIRVTVTDFAEPTTQTYRYSDGLAPFSYKFSYQNRTTSTRVFNIALGLFQDGQFKDILLTCRSVESNLITTWTSSGNMNVSASWWLSKYGVGAYQVKVVSRMDGTEEWLESADADKWYVDVIIESDQVSYVLHQYEEPEVVLGLDSEVTVSVGVDGLATYCPSNGVDFSNATQVAAYKASVSGSTLTLTKVETVAAGEGVLLRSLSGGSAEETLPTIKATKNDDNAFAGTLVTILLNETNGDYTNFVLTKKDGVVGFFKANNTTVAAGKAYLPVKDFNAATARGLNIVFDDDTATGISEVAPEAIDDDAIYTLGGARIVNPAKGIYVKNGKKVVIK